jgi:hypothetical protein
MRQKNKTASQYFLGGNNTVIAGSFVIFENSPLLYNALHFCRLIYGWAFQS